jgi:hypothetical protein
MPTHETASAGTGSANAQREATTTAPVDEVRVHREIRRMALRPTGVETTETKHPSDRETKRRRTGAQHRGHGPLSGYTSTPNPRPSRPHNLT